MSTIPIFKRCGEEKNLQWNNSQEGRNAKCIKMLVGVLVVLLKVVRCICHGLSNEKVTNALNCSEIRIPIFQRK